MDEKTSILDKKLDDLTLRDSLKINLVVVAAAVATPVVIGGVSAGVKALKQKLQERKASKTTEVVKTEAE